MSDDIHQATDVHTEGACTDSDHASDCARDQVSTHVSDHTEACHSSEVPASQGHADKSHMDKSYSSPVVSCTHEHHHRHHLDLSKLTHIPDIPTKIDKPRITKREIEVAIGITIVAVVSLFVPHQLTTAMATSVIVCTQIDRHEARLNGWRRMIGTLFGGLLGLAVVLIDDYFGNQTVLFLVLAFIAILFIGAVFYSLHLPGESWKIMMISLALVMLVSFGHDRVFYALWRLTGTLLGVLLGIIITTVWDHTAMYINDWKCSRLHGHDSSGAPCSHVRD